MTKEELKNWRKSMDMNQIDFGRWVKPQRTRGVIIAWETGIKPIPEWLDTLKELTDLKRR